MQSDERVVSALSALRPAIDRYRLAASGALERARAMLAFEPGPGRTRAALGEFAGGRIDPERFALVSAGADPLDATGREVVEHVIELIEDLLSASNEQFFVSVGQAGGAAEAIRARLTGLGTVYASARILDLVKRHGYDRLRQGSPSDGYPFEQWTAAERALAPPLVVRLDGSTLDGLELAPLVDGCVRLVLIVDGPAAPAPLARLVSPGAVIAQVHDVSLLAGLGDFDGPAVIAVMQGQEARFVHDPRVGSAAWKRIRIDRMPTIPPRKTLGSRSAWQQRDDLAHLKALVEPPSLAHSAAGAGNGHADPTDRLTAWLIEQSGPPGVA